MEALEVQLDVQLDVQFRTLNKHRVSPPRLQGPSSHLLICTPARATAAAAAVITPLVVRAHRSHAGPAAVEGPSLTLSIDVTGEHMVISRA